jgi:hypothetical protein
LIDQRIKPGFLGSVGSVEKDLEKDLEEDSVPSSSVPSSVLPSNKKIKFVKRKSIVESQEEKEEEIDEDQIKLECVNETRNVIGNATNIWKQYFPKGTKELVLNPFPNCTYYPLIIIYKQVYGKVITIQKLKTILIEEYQKYLKYQEKIILILSLQGKRNLMEKITKKQATLEETIISDIYPLSNLDYWLISSTLGLPVILFTSMKSIKHLLNGASWLRLGENKDFSKREYYFIRAPTEKDSKIGVNEIHPYSMITPGISLEEMPEFQEVFGDANMEESINLINLETYFSGTYI